MKLPVVFFVGLLASELRAEPDELILAQSGDLPIVLSAPHGGGLVIEGVPVRKGREVSRFVTKKDMWTDELTMKLANEIEKKTGKRPYVVIAKFHRKYLDANRTAELAYESSKARKVYNDYHQAVAVARREVVNRWGSGILFDVHGQATDETAIFRGTQNGRTTAHLTEKYGEEALIGGKSVFGQLAKQGIVVRPELKPGERETQFTGGYITRTYGSASGGSMDAIQLELGRDLRSPKQNDETAEKMATAIVAFAKEYLPQKELSQEKRAELRRGIRVGVYQDIGAGRSLADLLETLKGFEKVTVRAMTAADIRAGVLNDVDLLIQPGGSGSKQGRNLGEDGREKIRGFVREGGGYLGICAGAYLASADEDYDWSLEILDARVIDKKHWARGTGMVRIEVTKEGQRFLKLDRDEVEIYYGQGPLLAPANDPDIEDYQEMAAYQTEIAKNRAPKGVMIGRTAVAVGAYGKGRVVCFSPHPEKTKELDDLVWQAIEHVRKK